MTDTNDKTAQRASWQAKFHVAMALVWVVLIPPTLIWWSQSIMWVLLISIYANIVSHVGAYQAAHAEKTGALNP